MGREPVACLHRFQDSAGEPFGIAVGPAWRGALEFRVEQSPGGFGAAISSGSARLRFESCCLARKGIRK